MSVKSFLANWIVRNLLLALLFVALFVTAVSLALKFGTRHNEEIVVPDFTNMTYQEAHSVAQAAGVTVLVSDSVYVRRMKPGAVYMQTPKAGSYVKEGRKVRLTTNTILPEEAFMPSLVGGSLKQAKAELLRSGLVLGRISYVPDIATNYVLRQQRYGVDVAPGTPMSSGTEINLVLGLSTDNTTFVPDLIGEQYMRSVDLLHENSLNVGRLRFDETIRDYSDSISALVYSHSPAYGADVVKKGENVDLFLTLDLEKVKKAEAKLEEARKEAEAKRLEEAKLLEEQR